jgi:glutamate racemase
LPLLPVENWPVDTSRRPVVVYDSGVGGLTVARHIKRLCPDQPLVYLADNAWFPYGLRRDLELRGRVFALLHMVVTELAPRAVVIACNTASTAIAPTLDDLTEEIPIFTVFPPIEQTLAATGGGRTALLATPSTVRRASIRRTADAWSRTGRLSLVPTMPLVYLAERKLAGERVGVDEVIAAVEPVLDADDRRAVEGVVLGCTHFPWLIEELSVAFPAVRCWGDPAIELAQRVCSEIGAAGLGGDPSRPHELLLTSDHNREELEPVFARHGFVTPATMPLPVSA